MLFLEQPITTLWTPAGLSARLPGIGPSSGRIIAEVLEHGRSATVDKAIAESGKQADVETRRGMRSRFFSRVVVREILADTRLGGPTLADYRGDLQMHSTWSDGANSVADLASACVARGYRYAAITDHAPGRGIIQGLTMTAALVRHQEIDRLNAASEGFRIFKGIEANITPEGGIDLAPDDAREFEVVLAAPHWQLRTANDQTARLLRTVADPNVDVLAHPRGRKAGERSGLVADWDQVFALAAKEGVAIEIDGDPRRQDLDYDLASRALAAGCHFALDSDAHSPEQLVFAETAVAHARLAKIPPDRIVNCWELDRLEDWLTRRRSP
jgi:histidinol phosphatase-like PHP family hydrolase